ncbi:MAG: rRNA pseudouridine synthase [Proteobacteria bacterium]|nr:rRNA pseudouridine synthase [Pseudomonadota bacterium]MBU1737481.1 rRNA pseudouridine synthase [Pseudomonadota bacterium]
MNERLQKILASAGICSRRQAEKYILSGRVAVDGEVVTSLGTKADPGLQNIEFDGHPLSSPDKICILLHKPRGFVTTMSDPQGRPTVTTLLKGLKSRVYPVGRLDLDTSGALLLTNDGDLAQRLLHPSNEINRTYDALVRGVPAGKDLQRLARGIMLEGRKTWPADLEVLHQTPHETLIRIVIHEGRKRQVRKIFAAIGHPVKELKRVAYGGLWLENIPEGKYRLLTQNDIRKLFI